MCEELSAEKHKRKKVPPSGKLKNGDTPSHCMIPLPCAIVMIAGKRDEKREKDRSVKAPLSFFMRGKTAAEPNAAGFL